MNAKNNTDTRPQMNQQQEMTTSEQVVNEVPEVPDKTKKQKRKRKYPLVKAPCRSAYQLYIKEKAAENTASGGPKKQLTDYVQQWQEEKDKSRWEQMAKEELERFIEEVKSHGYEYKPKNKKSKTGGSRSANPYFLYAQEHVRKVESDRQVSYREAVSIVSQNWKNLGDVEKQKYIEEAKRIRESAKNDNADQ